MWWWHLQQQQQQQEYDASAAQLFPAEPPLMDNSLLRPVQLFSFSYCAAPGQVASTSPINSVSLCSSLLFATLYFLELELFDTFAENDFLLLYSITPVLHFVPQRILLQSWSFFDSVCRARLQLLPAEPPGEDVARLPRKLLALTSD